MADDHSSDPWGDQSPEEEIRAKAEQVLQDNRDALRLFVEQALWDALDQPERLKDLQLAPIGHGLREGRPSQR
jgi:hypothetical protein